MKLSSIQDWIRDLRHATRVHRQNPWFTLAAVGSLALAIGANTAIFSFAKAILLNHLPVRGSDRLVVLREYNSQFQMENCCFRYAFFQDLRRQNIGFEDVLAVASRGVTMNSGDVTTQLQAEAVSGNYFRMLGIRPSAGRLLNESDDKGAAPVCVISYRLWQQFGGRMDVVGSRVLINNAPFQVVGVSEPGFTGAALHEPHDMQVPALASAKILGDNPLDIGWAQIVARQQPGVSLAQAEARFSVAAHQIERAAGDTSAAQSRYLLRDGSQGIGSRKQDFGKPVLLLFVLVSVVLIVACANLSGLLMTRYFQRTREAALRIALGASRANLVRQFLTEALLLTIAGGVAGIAVASVLIRILFQILGQDGKGLVGLVRLDVPVLAFSFTVAITAGILMGLLPAWRTSQADPIQSIHGAANQRYTRSTASRLLLAGQIAFSLALLFGAGLFQRTLQNLRAIPLGFRADNVVLAHLDLSGTAHSGRDEGPFFAELLRRARGLPDTQAASLSLISVLSGGMAAIVMDIPRYASPNHQRPVASFTKISPEYFRTLGISISEGRDFADQDGADVAIVNRQFASRFLGGNALGQSFAYGGGRKVHVVGVVTDSKFRTLKEDSQPILYLSALRKPSPSSLFLQVRNSRNPAQVMEQLRAILRDMDRRVPFDSMSTMAIQLDEALARERLLAFLSSLTGCLAISLAAIGLYASLAFSVARRVREIGVRMAIGSPRTRVLTLFLREGLGTALIGILAGIPLALAGGKLASSLLYGLTPTDPMTTVAAASVLLLISFAATLIPAWRATGVDPSVALRHE